jgi:hypothetical protein
MIACVLCGIVTTQVALAADVAVGVNVRGYGAASEKQQDALPDQLEKDGVKTIREALPNDVNGKFTHFITSEYRHGIGLVAILYPTAMNSTWRDTMPISPRTPASAYWAYPTSTIQTTWKQATSRTAHDPHTSWRKLLCLHHAPRARRLRTASHQVIRLLRPCFEGGEELLLGYGTVMIAICGRKILRNRRRRLSFLLAELSIVIRIQLVKDLGQARGYTGGRF